MTTEQELPALIGRLRDGDPHALAELFAQYQDRLRRLVDLRLDHRLRGRVSASDVIQETFLDALKRVPHYREKPDLPFYVWLRWVANQRLVEVHRQHLGARMRDAGQEVSLNRGPGAGPGWTAASSFCLAARLAGNDTSPSQAAMRSETLGALQDVLDSLDPIDREILALRHFEELTNQEVAATLGIDKSAASKRYVRALARLREALAGLPDFEGLEAHV